MYSYCLNCECRTQEVLWRRNSLQMFRIAFPLHIFDKRVGHFGCKEWVWHSDKITT